MSIPRARRPLSYPSAAFAGRQEAGILDTVVEDAEHARAQTEVLLIHKNRATLQEIAVRFEREVERGVQERVPWTDECGKGLALRRDERLLEHDSFVSLENRLTNADLPVATPHGRRHMRHFVPTGFTLAGSAAET